MAPVGFGDISQPAYGVLGRDFFHNGNTVQVTTSTPGVNFNVRGTLLDNGSLAMNVSGRHTDKPSGITVTQGITDKNQLSTKFELNKPGLRSDVAALWTGPGNVKKSMLNVNYTNALLNSKFVVDLMNPAQVAGMLTLGHGNFVGGSEVHYNVASNQLTKYALALGHYPATHNMTFMITDTQLLSMTLYQRVAPRVEVAARSTIKLDKPSKNTIEIATTIRNADTQYKAKINDVGLACLSYMITIRKGVKLGLGISLDTLNPWDTFKKFGWSITVSQ